MFFFVLLFINLVYTTVQDQWMSVVNPVIYSPKTIEYVLNNGGYAIISAGRNPASQTDLHLNDSIIEERTEKLINDIKNTYLYSPIIGVYDGAVEKSFFLILHNISPTEEFDELVQLGSKYNQDSIIYVKQAKPTIQQLVYTTGQYRDRYVQGTGYHQLSPNATDNYSRIQLCPNRTFQFTLHFNFKYMFVDQTRTRTNQLITHHYRNQQANKAQCHN